MINYVIEGTQAARIIDTIRKITDKHTPYILRKLGVRFVMLHLDKYQRSEEPDAVDIIGEIPDLGNNPNFSLVKKFDKVEVYSVTKNKN